MADAREIGKDPDAFRTISEVAEELSLPQHVLRFWETRFHQIKPVKRAGGRRFYRPEDVDLLRGIRRLLYEDGFTIKGAQKILKEQGIRHVQDMGIEGDVAAIRSAAGEDLNPAAAPEGKSFGGLLGLLPLRRKEKEEPLQKEPPALDEPPLPFPELEMEDDFQSGDDTPDDISPRHIRASTQRVEERRLDGAVYEERIIQERRFEEDFPLLPPDPTPASPPPRATRHEDPPPFPDDEDDAMEPPDMARIDPSFAPEPAREPSREPRRRAEPVLHQRPTRGPAAHIASAPRPEFQDPLLPFMDGPQIGDEASESLEDRIRRLKEQERHIASSAAADEPGPPSEYVPPRHRHGAEASHMPSSRLEDMEPDDLPSVVRGHARYEQDSRGVSTEARGDDVRRTEAHMQRGLDDTDRDGLSRANVQPDYVAEDEGHHRMAVPGHFDIPPAYSPQDRARKPAGRIEQEPAHQPSPAPRRFGPFTEPVVEEFDIPPVDMRRTPGGRPAWEERSAWEEQWPEPQGRMEAHRPTPRTEERMPLAGPAPRMRYGVDPRHAEPAGAYVPHPARVEMHMPGQGVMPVLSRDDIHRLQAALYELSECQRLMESVLDDGKP